jgi:pyruvate dehydrogenase E2 component (dihydrolipoamide acetyltransferase)
VNPYGEVTRTRMTRTQRLIAERMAASRASVPEFAVTSTVAMDAAMVWLRDAKARAEPGAQPSVNDVVIRACALALRAHPRANGRYADAGFLELPERVNVGLAVAVPDALLVPTLFDADRLSIWQLARETRALVQRAREGALSPAEMSGATFTVSNLGMLGVEQFSAVINAPQAAILSVGAVRRAPVVRGDDLAIGLVATLTLNCDHRVVYGADAAELLTAIQRILEAPEALAGADR